MSVLFLGETDMQYLSDIELLGGIFGEWEAKRMYKGSLIPLFLPSSIMGHTHRRLVAAHELVTPDGLRCAVLAAVPGNSARATGRPS
jgi:hypothetical protein